MVKSVSMDVDETLEIDYSVEDFDSDIVTVDKNTGFSKSYYSTDTFVFDPSDTGSYQVDLNGEIIEINVTDIPSRSNFPTSQGNAAVFTEVWSPSVSNLSTSHDESTFQVPSGVNAVRCIAYGAGSQGGNTNDSQGGFVDAVIPVSGGDEFKVIVGGNGDPTQGSGRGGHGAGGGSGPDGNSDGCGAGGSAIARSTSPLTNGMVVAGGGGTGGGHGSGGNGFDGDKTTNTGASSDGTGGSLFKQDGSTLAGGEYGKGGASADDGYGNSYVAGSGAGAGAGGGGSDQGSGQLLGEDKSANSWGGKGGGNTIDKPGAGGVCAGSGGAGGNGIVIDGDPVGGGAGGGHGTAQGGGGFAGGGAAYCCSDFGGGGGSGKIVNKAYKSESVQNKYVDPSNITTSQGSLFDISGISGSGLSTSVPSNRGSYGENGMCIILW